MEMEEAGVVEKGWHKKISTSSTRRGGNTTAAIGGIRETVRKKHGRWLSDAVREYDDVGEGEENLVTQVLGARLQAVVQAWGV